MSAHRAASDLFKAPVEIQDPGNAGKINVDRNPCVVNLVSAGAETRTLNAPTEPGADLTISGFTIAGTITITVTGGYDVAGSTTITITAAKQWIRFVSVQESTGVYRWRLVSSNGPGSAGVAGVAGGYKLARGITALDGSNPTPIVTGLATVVAAVLTLENASAPGVGTSVLTIDPTDFSTGQLDVYAWKPTSNSNPTLIASTGTENVHWIAIGT